MNTWSRGRISLGMVGLLVIVMAFALIAVVSNMARTVQHPQRRSCSNNLHQLGLAIGSYTSDWDDIMPGLRSLDQKAPEGKAWPDLLMVYVKNDSILRCPDSSDDRLTYALNRRVADTKVDAPQATARDTIAVYETVNDSPENNNLNGDTIWCHRNGGLPKPGQYVLWDGEFRRYTYEWPPWAKPRHKGENDVLFMDGHVEALDPTCAPRFVLRAQEK